MAARTPRKQHEEEGQEPASFDEMMPETRTSDALIDHLKGGFTGLHLHLDKVNARVDALIPQYPLATSDGNRPKVIRRRSLDDMQFALKRLVSLDPRPEDDDSPQVLQDAINETIALRQLVQDVMQSSMNIYQRGLTAIRDMTNQ